MEPPCKELLVQFLINDHDFWSYSIFATQRRTEIISTHFNDRIIFLIIPHSTGVKGIAVTRT